MSKELTRKDIPEKYRWDIQSMFKSYEDWDNEHDIISNLADNYAKYEGELTSDKEILLKGIKDYEILYRGVSNLYSYSSMNLDVDTRDSNAQALKSKAIALLTKVSEKTSFFIPEILATDEDVIADYMNEDSELKEYNQMFKDILRKKNHVLSAREEAIMAQVSELGDASSNTYSMINNADLKFPKIKDENGVEVEVTHGNFIPFMENENRQVRKDAYEALYSVYEGFKNTLTSTLAGELKSNIFNSKMRKYESSRHASLDDNNIPLEVYDNLIESIHDNLGTMHEYMDIRKEILGVDKLHMYDIYTPIVKDVDFKYTYDEGVELIKEALKPLGEEYMEHMVEGFDSRWVDVYETRGKRSGAYSGGSYDSDPFILLNYKETLDNVFTVAHEMGHSMHSFLTRKYQPYIYGSYSIFLAEVASTTNELLLLNYMLENAKNEDEKRYLLNHYIESFRTTVFRQTMFAEFEMIINKYLEDGGALTSDYLCETYKKLNELYYGPDVVMDDKIAIEWARIPHFYYNFYVFQYATGFSAAVDFSTKIIKEGKPAVDKYLEFLKSGSSEYAIEILQKAGVDMTTKSPVDNGMKLFKELVEEFAELSK